jgi:hypothetical protein
VGEKAHLLKVPGCFRKFEQGLISWAVDAWRIGEVLVDDLFKRFKQFLLRAQSALPGRITESEPARCCSFGESHDSRLLAMKIFVSMDPAPWSLWLPDASIGRRTRVMGRTPVHLRSLLDFESSREKSGRDRFDLQLQPIRPWNSASPMSSAAARSPLILFIYLAPKTDTDGRRRFPQYLANVRPFVPGSPEHQNGAMLVAEFWDDPGEFQSGVHLTNPTLVQGAA